MRAHVTRAAAVALLSLWFAASAAAQLEVVPQWRELFTLTPAAPAATRPMLIDTASRVHIMVTAQHKNMTVALVSPGGTRYVIGTTAPNFESTVKQHDNPLGANYHAFVTQPATGTWQLEVSAPGISSNLPVLVNVLPRNRTILAVVGDGQSMPAGAPTPLSLAVFDGTDRLRTLTITAVAYGPNNATSQLAFQDDGTSPDAQAGDGIYTAVVATAVAGEHQVEIDVRGVASTGSFRRSGSATVLATVKTATLDGTFTDAGVDDDADGMFDSIVISPRMSVSQAGTYNVRVQLRGAQGQTLSRTSTTDLAVGTTAVGVPFGAREVLSTLISSGPYDVSMVEVEHHVPSDVVLVDRRINLGPTQAYSVDDLQHERLRLSGPGSTTPVDLNGNGRYDELRISLPVTADIAGTYSYSGSLYAPDGVSLGTATGQYSLVQGQNSITLAFPGLPIGTHSVNGPYSMSLLLYGAGQSLLVSNAFTTPAYAASQFEIPVTTIAGFTPSAGGAGLVVTIEGTGLTGATSVTFNGLAAASFTVVDDTTIAATVPAGATSGLIRVNAPWGSAASSTPFTVNLIPAIGSFTPTEGLPSTYVVIAGANFLGATSVTFNGASASFTVAGANTIMATVPGSATTGPISVTNSHGTGTSAGVFSLPPSIDSMVPGWGPPGKHVFILGKNLAGATRVSLDEIELTFVVEAPGRIKATIPNVERVGYITVVTPHGTARSEQSFTASTLIPWLTATATGPTSIALSWNGNPTHTYQVQRISKRGEFFDDFPPVATVTGNTFVDTSVLPGKTYLYIIKDVNTRWLGTVDHATTVMFTDAPFTQATNVSAVHLSELRAAADALRVAAALPPFTWTDPAPAGATIRQQHIVELRAAIEEGLALFNSYVVFTDPVLAGRVIRAVHFSELQNAVK
ncbi:MAG TPA: IPT/TIG domain-containing protein [Thermoanaerobaculia bacterium]|nr:IPT/TIG domain-containing protein [Thermoanaerobaculia bacterium]